MNKVKRFNGVAIKLIITVVLLSLLVRKMAVSEVVTMVSGLNLESLGISVLLTVAAVILSAYKWQLLLVARGCSLSIGALTKYYFVGLFMNNFLPSSIGGDLMRIYQVGKRIGNSNEAAASVVLERLLAAIGLIIPAVVALLPNRILLGKVLLPVISFLVICLIFAFIIAKPAIVKPLARVPWKWWQKTVTRLREINNIIQAYRSKPAAVIKVIVYSVMFQMVVVCINYCLVRAMGISHISLWQCTLMVPVISAVSMIPISINGLGVREGAYVLLFGTLGLSSSQAVTLSLLFFIIVTVVSLVGGIFFVLEREKESYVTTR